MRVAHHSRCLDAAVQQLAGLGQLPPHAPEPAQRRDEHEKELSLPGCPRDRQCASGMELAVGVLPEIELRPCEPGRRLAIPIRVSISRRKRRRCIRGPSRFCPSD